MGSLLRKEDEKCSNIVSDFLDEHFYLKKTELFERINDKERQIQGIDVIFSLKNVKYICDEKAAIRYVNKNLRTFSLELSFRDRGGNLHNGWLIDETKINDSFLFIWIDKAKYDILTSKEDIQELEFALVSKKSIIEYLKSIGWEIPKLIKKSELIREDENEYCGNLYEDGCKFVCSRFLYEKPVNVLLKRDLLKKISVYNEKIVVN
jgi:hypothetical protein